MKHKITAEELEIGKTYIVRLGNLEIRTIDRVIKDFFISMCVGKTTLCTFPPHTLETKWSNGISLMAMSEITYETLEEAEE